MLCCCRTDEVCGHCYPDTSRRPAELEEAPPPTWTAVLASWVVAAVAIPLAAVWQPYDRLRTWLARVRSRR